ncbi:NADH-quinone oxidoreductase subunit NuoH [Dehalogenimonas etheniformans]|uniref:NADH-quinone oxidoreductase subunit H n=1 Tax=Dehalogenimonas etheniformans TaxID=1536648 RepID=A0A2P5P4P2_9CHLR|nr:NADH-quinone oxidoreductase subunit NuoH [Dehalogenimonas etheniformans]PPD57264.1 NADH-quinone oxidoreductase subunit NuoH [Dehalogenimonas etheniformans]QNT76183.1 NADH-quinone oxidoreductase subunit NuoH [Dehalogenimonas etheniformans]
MDWLHFAVFTLIIFVFVISGVLFFIWFERRGLGRFQIRPGPNRAGPFGLLQPLADAVKVLLKEDIVPALADKPVHFLAPLIAFVPALAVFAVIPFGDGALLANLNIGILYIMSVSSVVVIGIFMAGWSSSNKYSLLGAMRTIAQEVSYEIPLVLSILGAVMLAGSLSLDDIVKAQNIPFILLQPLGFLIYMTAAMAEINRTPFDLLEADSEIIAGFQTEYSGMKFGLFYLTEYAETLSVSAIASTLFLGGWAGPLLPGFIWLLIKIVAVFTFIMWVRATFPRLRIDQVMAFGWKFLLPLAMLNLILTAVLVLTGLNDKVWLAVPLNFALAFILIIGASRQFRTGGGHVIV